MSKLGGKVRHDRCGSDRVTVRTPRERRLVTPSSVTQPDLDDVDAGAPLDIVQVVRSDGFAGVERYITQISESLCVRGHRMTVIGGDPQQMVAALPPEVVFSAAPTLFDATRALLRHRRTQLVHAHMTAAELSASLTHPIVRAPIVATRHFAADRGRGPVARLIADWSARSVACDIAISAFVAGRVRVRPSSYRTVSPHRNKRISMRRRWLCSNGSSRRRCLTSACEPGR